MWNILWYSLGRAGGIAVRSVASTPGPERWPRRILRGTIQANFVPALLGLTGVASAAFRRMRAVLILSGMQLFFDALLRMLRSRSGPSPVEKQAERVAQLLRERGVIPNRFGIDGLPGSGKSTLARLLAERLGMEWKSLDYKNLGLPGILGQGRTIYEHHRLLRTQDVDAFDAIVYIDEPFERSRAKVLRRGRGLILAAVLDYDKLKKVGKLAFDVCEGEPVRIPKSDLVLKIKPPKGFRAVENITSRLGSAPSQSKGDAGFDTSGMSKEEMLFVLAHGKRQEGLTAYLLPLTYLARMGSLVAALHSAGRRFVIVLCADDSALRQAQGARSEQ